MKGRKCASIHRHVCACVNIWFKYITNSILFYRRSSISKWPHSKQSHYELIVQLTANTQMKQYDSAGQYKGIYEEIMFVCSGRIPRLSLIRHSLYVGVVEKSPPPPLTGEQYGKMEPKYPEGGHYQSVFTSSRGL